MTVSPGRTAPSAVSGESSPGLRWFGRPASRAASGVEPGSAPDAEPGSDCWAVDPLPATGPGPSGAAGAGGVNEVPGGVAAVGGRGG